MTFFLSSVLDNLTSTIIMVSLLRKLVPPSEFRKYVLTIYYLSLLCEVLFKDCLILVSADIIQCDVTCVCEATVLFSFNSFNF